MFLIEGKRIFYVLEAMTEVEENRDKDFRKIRVILIEDNQKIKYFAQSWTRNRRKKGHKKVKRLTLRFLDFSIMS